MTMFGYINGFELALIVIFVGVVAGILARAVAAKDAHHHVVHGWTTTWRSGLVILIGLAIAVVALDHTEWATTITSRASQATHETEEYLFLLMLAVVPILLGIFILKIPGIIWGAIAHFFRGIGTILGSILKFGFKGVVALLVTLLLIAVVINHPYQGSNQPVGFEIGSMGVLAAALIFGIIAAVGALNKKKPGGGGGGGAHHP